MSREKKLRTLLYATIMFFSLWIGWVLVLLQFPETLGGETPMMGAVHIIIRIVLWSVPVIYYARVAEGQSYFQFLGLTVNLRRGLWGGAALLGIVLLLNGLQMFFQGATYRGLDSISVAGWLNPIIGAPYVEEVVFRGMLFRKLDENVGTVMGVVVNSALFAGIHFPYWFLSGTISGWPLIQSLFTTFAIGVVLSISMKLSRSLITPMIGHWANNLFSILIR